jgi:hypothetical protein
MPGDRRKIVKSADYRVADTGKVWSIQGSMPKQSQSGPVKIIE